MPKDERIFRVVKQGYRGEKITYHSRTSISGMFGTAFGNPARPDILRVEAIDPTTIPWADVTDEFRNKPKPKCGWHPAYTGVRKPHIWSYNQQSIRSFFSACTCWKLYAENHPDYPVHDELCAIKHLDPTTCSCQILRKLTE